MSEQLKNKLSNAAQTPSSDLLGSINREPGKYGFLPDRKDTGSRKMRYVEGSKMTRACKLCK
ncbi:MAG: hypothetical protein KUG80_06510 [Gammaproteobacteria bacterium]|nr:hypothetical protein [Gammaproteobacteria bacterium]